MSTEVKGPFDGGLRLAPGGRLTVGLDVAYHQLCVFDGAVSRSGETFNAWEDVHVAQGFVWRRGSLSFSMIENGLHRVEVAVRRPEPLAAAVRRAILLPFTVDSSGEVELAVFESSALLVLDPGDYAVTCEQWREPDGLLAARLTFEKDGDPAPAIVRADDELEPPDALDLNGRPAT